MVTMRPWISVMQDNASAHAAALTMEDMSQWLIQPISWPANSPDLDLIEGVWDRMRDYIQLDHPNLSGGKQLTPISLSKIVEEV
ncbi:unnamed protein product [Blumeria hordei]|uniref:Tc1-like transposase DDE domain-containing protein n=1 Tax=Blumeria hordei TaxID=2867405 RepID=A0A383URN3_BLUHO|nr:unnamed protein product [Blumeria hordei]